MREEEIVRLREGWEHMERRWRDVLNMMEGWLRRMDTGDTINIDDLRRGMGLVSPVASRVRGVQEAQKDIDQSLVESDASAIELSDIQEESFVASSRRPSSRPTSSSKRKRDVLEPPEFFDLRPTRSTKPMPGSPAKSVSDNPPLLGDDDESEDLEIPQMTIAEKLSAAQEEAEQAAAAAARTKSPAHVLVNGTDDCMNEEKDDTLGKMPGDTTLGKIFSPIRTTRIKGRPRKRKSTLSPDELEALIGASEE
jgi:hypothetical protein